MVEAQHPPTPNQRYPDPSAEDGIASARYIGCVLAGAGLVLGGMMAVDSLRARAPSVEAQVEVESAKPRVISMYQQSKLCLGGYTVESGAKAKVQAVVNTGDIPGIDLGIGDSHAIPGAWMSEEVKGPTNIAICQLDAQVTVAYDPNFGTVTTLVPAEALVFDAYMPADKKNYASDRGALAVQSDVFANIWSIIDDGGLAGLVNDQRSTLRQIAEMKNVDNAVKKCGPALQKQVREIIQTSNKENVVKWAKVFGVELNESNITTTITGGDPGFRTGYGESLDVLTGAKYLQLSGGAGGECDVADGLAVERVPSGPADVSGANS